MRHHSGAHPRMGAVDVCPFVPVANTTTEECVECSKRFGERCGKELGIPVYLYEVFFFLFFSFLFFSFFSFSF